MLITRGGKRAGPQWCWAWIDLVDRLTQLVYLCVHRSSRLVSNSLSAMDIYSVEYLSGDLLLPWTELKRADIHLNTMMFNEMVPPVVALAHSSPTVCRHTSPQPSPIPLFSFSLFFFLFPHLLSQVRCSLSRRSSGGSGTH